MEWQPIETAPRDKAMIDIWAKQWNAKTDEFEFRRFAGCFFDESGNIWGMPTDYRATHWMPLPEPPK